ncbi:MAG: AAA family ATPase [Leptospiraceae bacterium]|nr:AAA family ATPase [Leptospiraceae bacterium]
MHFSDFELITEIYRTNNRVIQRVKNKDSGLEYVLKYPAFKEFDSNESNNLKKEFEIMGLIHSPRVLKAIDFLSIQSTPVLVLENFRGTTLRKLLSFNRFSLRLTLKIIIKIVEGLRDIHNQNIIHKDIKPDNILIQPNTGELKVIDFGISTLLSKESTSLTSINRLEGSLHYISPEQTGRMNRSIDYRSDFYSLGVVFYELLTGQKPFDNKDAIELVHSHIAKNPESPEKIDPRIPQVLAEIVLKLMSKSQEDRYKSHGGILYDLETSLQKFKQFKSITNFKIGTKDVSTEFRISEKLYGREKEISELLSLYDICLTGKQKFVLIDGASGTGKSSLVYEIRKSILARKGYFLSGKYEQYQREIPYSAVVNALREFLKAILYEEDSRIEVWKDQISNSLGENSGLLLNLIPELEFFVPQKINKSLELSPYEIKNLFLNTLLSLIRSISKGGVPITFFLDDLQWVDSSSIEFLKQLLTELNDSSIFILGSYRDNEIDEHHQFFHFIEDLERSKYIINRIHLGSLQLKDIQELTSDSMNLSFLEVFELSQLILEKTGGNPFFVNEFLYNLAKNKILRFDFSKDLWCWETSEIINQSITLNLTELILSRVNQLTSQEKEVLKIASCLGGNFSLIDLLLVLQNNSIDWIQSIWVIVKTGILKLDGYSNSSFQTLIFQNEKIVSENIRLSFAHDKIQASIYNLLNEEETTQYHRRIALALKTSFDKSNDPKLIPEIISFLIKSIKLVEEDERFEFAILSLKASEIATSSGAFQNAYEFLSFGKNLLIESDWNFQYKLVYSISIKLAETAYILSEFKQSENLFAEILLNANSNIDKARVYEIQVVQLANNNELLKAVDAGRKGLALFGVKLPLKSPLPMVLFQVIKATFQKGQRTIEDIYHLPNATNDEVKIIARLLNHLSSPTYGTDQNLFAYVVATAVLLTLKNGLTESSAYMFGLYAALVGSKLGLFKSGERFGHLSIRLSEKFPSVSQRCRANFAMGTFVYAWTQHSRKSFKFSLESFKLARETGDNIYSCYSIVEYCSKLLSLGDNLEDTHKVIAKYTDYVVNKVKDKWIGTLMLAMHNSILNLLEKTKNPLSLSNENFDEESYVKKINLEGEGQMDWYHTNKAKIFYLYEEYEKALEMILKAEEKMVYSFACIITAEQNFYHSLTLSALIDANPKLKSKYLNKMKKNNSILRNWAYASKENFLHKSLLIDAEIARHQEKFIRAESLYDSSIQEAEKNGYTQNYSIANELAGKYFAQRNKLKIASIYIQDAYEGYEKWGAVTKIKLFETKWKKYLKNHFENRTLTKTISMTATTSSDFSTSMILDLSTVLKSSQVISSEIRLNSLLVKMLDIVMENAGAEKASFFVKENDNFQMIAISDINKNISRIGVNVSLDEGTEFPRSIINFVIRTKQALVIEDASIHETYKNDEYISTNQIKSILCIPIQFLGDLFGIIYLENNLTSGALSHERVELLKMLSSQISISYNNAKIYGELESMAESFARFVPRQFLEFLGKNRIQDISIGDAKRHRMTILFSDIRNFTGLSEKLAENDTFEFLNSYMRVMEPVIQKHQGFIDKFIGDAIMALFPDSPNNAVKASIEMKEALAKFNTDRRKEGKEDIQFGVGLHVGEIMLGTIGTSTRLETTVVGDAVNLASRLESMTKVIQTSVLISDSVAKEIPIEDQLYIREIGLVKVKGKEKSILLYELFQADPEELLQKKLKLKEKFESGLKHFYSKNFKDAITFFEECLEILSEDTPSKRFLEYSNEYLNHTLQESWDGSEVWS